MKRITVNIIPAIVLMIIAHYPAMAQGVYWESKTTGGGDKERVDMFYYMPGMMKMVGGDEGMAVILRLDKEIVIMVDPEKKAYYQMTFQEMEQMMEGAGAMGDYQNDMMKDQLAQLPEEQRKAVEEMMKSQKKPKGPNVEVSKTGETRTISGYRCQEYVLAENDERVATIWATHDVKEFELMREDMKEFARRMKVIAKRGMKDSPQLLEDIDGFPIATERVGGRTSIVTKIEERSTPANAFDPPADLSRETFPGMGQAVEE